MWQRFTKSAREVVYFAQEEATKLGENRVGTEHLLLGLMRKDNHIASVVLLRMHVDLVALCVETVRLLMPREFNPNRELKPSLEMSLTPGAKRAVDLAYDEARRLSNNYVGTEHLLLGLLLEGEGVACQALQHAGVDLETTRAEIKQVQPEEDSLQKGEAAQGEPAARRGWPVVRDAKPLQPSKDEAYPISQPREEAGRDTPGRGDIGALGNVDGRKNVEFVPDAADLPAFTEAMSLKDEFAYRDLLAEGKLLLLKAGTGAKFLRIETPDVYRIRILDGDHAGKIGFVLRHQLPVTCKDYRPFPPDIP